MVFFRAFFSGRSAISGFVLLLSVSFHANADEYIYCDNLDSPRLIISGGTDPSGAMAISLTADGEWKALNGVFYLATVSSAGAKTIYTSVEYEDPKMVISIDTDSQATENVFVSEFTRKGINRGKPIEIICRVKEID